MVHLMREAEIRFAVLGTEEKCTGDPARRIGDEFLFQQLALENIQTLNHHHVQRIVAPCPHCFHTIRNEYPQFGGSFEVIHHSQYLAELISSGRLKPRQNTGTITLHDPCYLSRVNGETQAQRTIVNSVASGSLREMPRRKEKTFCCGAGGGRMWFEEPPGQRVSRLRAAEAIDTGAGVLATACPYCLNMMTDGITGVERGETIQVMDIAELLIGTSPSDDPLC
jgi:Fe-S oxidoreductase